MGRVFGGKGMKLPDPVNKQVGGEGAGGGVEKVTIVFDPSVTNVGVRV